jgi:diaminohydroxyphosphoribosylaminopyrimidine deaminase/5-amino-6-(5-phosphoribosylamino)uracil reductase
MSILDLFWNHLIKAKNRKLVQQENFKGLYYSSDQGFTLDFLGQCQFYVSFSGSGKFKEKIELYPNTLFLEYDSMADNLLTFARLYLPLLFSGYFQKDRPFILTHFAQTLDGKICTDTGQSKWISNEENLIHCHRLRALVDGVLVGGETVKHDKPKLTVRKVEGENPIRIFWCNSIFDYREYQIENTKIYLIADLQKVKEKPPGIDVLVSYTNTENPIPEILVQLKSLGIHTLFVEGGNQTLSGFYHNQLVDLLQICIAPIVFGSGKSAIQTEPIDKVSESLKLNGFFSLMGNQVLYHGKPQF